MVFGSWTKPMFQALQKMKEPGHESPKPDTKDYWLQRCVIAEAALEKHVGDKEKGNAIMDMTSVNLKTDSYKEYRAALQDDLSNPQSYTRGFTLLRRLHAPLTGLLTMLTNNTTDARKAGKKRGLDDDACDRNAARRVRARGLVIESVLSQLQRLRSQNNFPIMTVAKSIVALRQGLKKSYWEAETRQRLLMGKQWTLELVVDMYQRGVEPPFPVSESVSFLVYDNCDYMKKKQFQRADDEGEYIKTVNWVDIPCDARHYNVDQKELGKSRSHNTQCCAPHC